jgi:hypothetical protein
MVVARATVREAVAHLQPTWQDAAPSPHVMDDDHLIGRTGRVTGSIGPGSDRFGEVLFDIRGGRDAYYAQPYDGEESIPVGAEVVVVAHPASRTVLVTAMPSPSPPEGA